MRGRFARLLLVGAALGMGACSHRVTDAKVLGFAATDSGLAWAEPDPSGGVRFVRWDRATEAMTLVGGCPEHELAGVASAGELAAFACRGAGVKVWASRHAQEKAIEVNLVGVPTERLLGATGEYVLVTGGGAAVAAWVALRWIEPMGNPTAAVTGNGVTYRFADGQLSRHVPGWPPVPLATLDPSGVEEIRAWTNSGWILWTQGARPTDVWGFMSLGTSIERWSLPAADDATTCRWCPSVEAAATDGESIYWVEGAERCGDCAAAEPPKQPAKALRRRPIAGKGFETVATVRGACRGLAADGSNVYWLDDDGLKFERR